MAKAWPKVKMKVARKITKGSPKDLGPRGKSDKPYSKTKPKAVAKTNASPNTKAIVARTPKSGGKMSDAEMKANKARTKRKLKANIKAAKPGAAKAAKTAAKKAAVKTTAKTGAKLAARAIPGVTTALLAGDALSAANKAGTKQRAARRARGEKVGGTAPRMKRKK